MCCCSNAVVGSLCGCRLGAPILVRVLITMGFFLTDFQYKLHIVYCLYESMQSEQTLQTLLAKKRSYLINGGQEEADTTFRA